jgi:colanic acid/amylovoran biosynthesis protein
MERIYFFAQVTGPMPHEDYRIAERRVANEMRRVSDRVSVIDQPIEPRQLKTLYGFMDVFVATRMHSGIFALSMGVPTLFIGYLTKTRGMLQDLGLEEWLLELGDLDERRFWEKLKLLWEARETVRARLLGLVPIIVEQTRGVGKLIAQDFSSLPELKK